MVDTGGQAAPPKHLFPMHFQHDCITTYVSYTLLLSVGSALGREFLDRCLGH